MFRITSTLLQNMLISEDGIYISSQYWFFIIVWQHLVIFDYPADIFRFCSSIPSGIFTLTKAESPLSGKCRGGKIPCSLIGYSNQSRRKILAAKSRDWFYFSQRDIFRLVEIRLNGVVSFNTGYRGVEFLEGCQKSCPLG